LVKIFKSQFKSALQKFSDSRKFEYNEWDKENIWQEFLTNKTRSGGKWNGQTGRQIWFPLIEPFLIEQENGEEEFVEYE